MVKSTLLKWNQTKKLNLQHSSQNSVKEQRHKVENKMRINSLKVQGTFSRGCMTLLMDVTVSIQH